MRLVIQRVSDARVTVEGRVVSEIKRGILVLVGLSTEDGRNEAEWACQKILQVKLFHDKGGKMWRGSVVDAGLEVLCVSQFTLFAELKKQDRPDFHRAMGAAEARELYGWMLEQLGAAYHPDKIKDGEFGAMMQVGLTNDGPVTITLDSSSDGKLQRAVEAGKKAAKWAGKRGAGAAGSRQGGQGGEGQSNGQQQQEGGEEEEELSSGLEGVAL